VTTSSASIESSSQQSKPSLAGIFPPIPTPFQDGRLDLDSLRRMLDDLVGSVDGVTVGGSLAEAASLSITERETVIRTVANHLDRDRALVVSITDNSLEQTRRLSDVAGECDAALLMLSCPNYFENDRPMLEAYFSAVADFASADLCLYDNPLASNTTLSVDDIVAIQLAAQRITHIKMTDNTMDKITQIRSRLDATIFCGDDAVLWHHLLTGAEGIMVSIPMVYPERTARMWKLVVDGDLEQAYVLYRKLSHFIHCALSQQDYPAVIKAVLHERGLLSSSEVRLPLLPLTRARRDEVFSALD
jgi:dihydrodipicolinate synthase/N-acetylneuraminate lyase